MKSSRPLWIEPQPVTVPQELLEVVHSPLTAELLVRRGILTTPAARAFLNAAFYIPADPLNLPDLGRAADELEKAIGNHLKIGVWGDFDVDGQTSTALFVSALRELGANVDYYIPVRAKDSHGMALPALENFLKRGIQLILTCDTGITAHESVNLAARRGIPIIITDHHTLPEILPAALAVVNPQRLPVKHALHPLCGVGTAFQLVKELFRRKKRSQEIDAYLDLVALGTIADVASLTADNRWLVQTGLEILRNNQRVGFKELYAIADLNPAQISEEHIGFQIAPRLNAIGRLADANPMVDLFTTTDIQTARLLVTQLEALNSQRKYLCDQVFAAAMRQIDHEPSLLNHSTLILHHPEWPAGVVGIVASRLAELFHRPVILLTGKTGHVLRGSARSIEGVNITEAIQSCSSLLLNFGGHPMAAGLGLIEENIAAFRAALNRAVELQTSLQAPVATLSIDAWVNVEDLNLTWVEQIAQLAPFGAGNPPPVFADRNLTILNTSSIGKNGEHLQLSLQSQTGKIIKVVWWQGAGSPLPEGKFDLAYQVRASSYRGQPEIQIEWIGARPLDEKVKDLRTGLPFEVLDFRKKLPQFHTLLNELDQQSTLIWKEGLDDPNLPESNQIPIVNRTKLYSAARLVIWGPPCGRADLFEALRVVTPTTVILLDETTTVDRADLLLPKIAGLTKFLLRTKNGRINITEMAAHLGHRPICITTGLDWLEASGVITVVTRQFEEWHCNAGGVLQPAKKISMENRLQTILQETAAFRDYYRKAQINHLLSQPETTPPGAPSPHPQV